MKNILFVHSSSELYGSDRSFLNIIQYIDKSYFNIFVILPSDGPLVNEINKIENVVLEIFDLAILRRKYLNIKGFMEYFKNFICSYKFFKKYIKENNIDIVYTNTSVIFPAAIAAKKSKKKSVWHIREIINSYMENKIISFFMKRYSDLIVANSKATKDALKISKNKIRVIYNGVEEKKYIPIKNESQQLIIGMAGRINSWKGQKLFVDSAEIVHKEFPNVFFKIAGEAYIGEEYLKEDLEKYIYKKKLSKNIFLLGQVNNMNEFYSSLDIFVLPSTQPEPFGLVLIEAMEFGIPVIATNHGGPTEIISDGVDGYLVDYKNCFEMAKRIEEFILDKSKRIEIGKKGQYKKRNIFTISDMVNNLDNIFKEI